MTRAIWKFALPTDRTEVLVPRQSLVRHFSGKGSELFLWVEVDPREPPTSKRVFLIRGTGEEFDRCNDLYIGTAVVGPFVWHLYEVIP